LVALVARAERRERSEVPFIHATKPCDEQSKDTMTDKTTSIFPTSGLIRHISLSALLPFFKKKNAMQAHYPQYISSVFSLQDQSALLAEEEEICPLVEAELFVIYGRKADAKKALDLGVMSGRITDEQVTEFWDTPRDGRQ
jgi:hypothetical protein